MRPYPLALLFGIALATAACGVGGIAGDDDEGSDTTGADGGGGGGDSPDAFPAENILCATEYTVTGDVQHAITPGESCEGSGQWNVTVGTPLPDDEYAGCAEAPGEESFTFQVAVVAEEYEATDLDDGGRAWTVQIRDKGGSCSATFKHDLGGGIEWALIPGEEGPDGPLDGTARFEKREQ